MEFKVFQKEIELQSRGWIPTFHDIRKEILEIVEASGVKNGTVDTFTINVNQYTMHRNTRR